MHVTTGRVDMHISVIAGISYTAVSICTCTCSRQPQDQLAAEKTPIVCQHSHGSSKLTCLHLSSHYDDAVEARHNV